MSARGVLCEAVKIYALPRKKRREVVFEKTVLRLDETFAQIIPPCLSPHCQSSLKSRCYPLGKCYLPSADVSPPTDMSPPLWLVTPYWCVTHPALSPTHWHVTAHWCVTPSDLLPPTDLSRPPLACHPHWHATPLRCSAMMAVKYLGLWGQISCFVFDAPQHIPSWTDFRTCSCCPCVLEKTGNSFLSERTPRA